MYFARVIDKYFAAWILRDTWYTGHPLDMERFYLFVYALHKLSKPIKMHSYNPDDPAIQDLPQHIKEKRSIVYERNPRTYDRDNFRKKLLRAIHNNHGFDPVYAEQCADEFTEKAMIFLDALEAVKKKGYPNFYITEWKPFLK